MDTQIIQDSLNQFVEDFDLMTFLKVMLVLSFSIFLIGIIMRVACGKKSTLNTSVSSALGILIIYVISFALQGTQNHYSIFMTALPYVSITGDYVSIFTLQGAPISVVCTELVNMMILAFLFGIISELIPKGKNFFVWYFLRCICVILTMGAHWLVQKLFASYLPAFIVTYAPVILLIIIIALLAVTVFKVIVGTLLGMTVHPIVGAIYTFFVSNIVGKEIAKSALTTLILTAIIYLLNYFGITGFYIASVTMSAFLPAIIIFIIVWYLLYKFL